MAESLPAEVRAHCARVAERATSVRIDRDALGALDGLATAPPPGLDPERHYLEGSEADVATYVLVLDTINFGSGWFPTLRKRVGADGRPVSGSFTTAWNLADRFRAGGAWSNGELRAMRADELADTLGQPRDHELMALYAQALRSLGSFLGARTALGLVAGADGSAATLARTLASSMTLWNDRGFYKRAQILPSDLALAGVARFDDLDALTIFADNLVPHVLRCTGVLTYAPLLAGHVDRGDLLPTGPWEREIRACAVHACALLARRLGATERELDQRLWNHGQAPAMKERPRHRCRTVFY